jgi:hypothetical protein
MLHYLYLDYGGRAQYRRELKYSLISLRSDLGQEMDQGGGARIAVYTDAPQLYARWPVEVVDIAQQTQAWSGDGLYHHRIKPAAVLDALNRFAAPVCFLDSDSIIRPGFHAEVSAKLAPQGAKSAVVMNHFELTNPFPPLKGFRTALPHLGPYHYDTANSWMFNSGLIGVTPAHVPVMEDVLVFIDALIGRARKFPTIEQLALSEVARLNQIPIAEVKDTFLHYWQGRRRIYMAGQIEKSLSSDWNDLTPPKQWEGMNYWAVRAYNYWYGVTHMFDGWRK